MSAPNCNVPVPPLTAMAASPSPRSKSTVLLPEPPWLALPNATWSPPRPRSKVFGPKSLPASAVLAGVPVHVEVIGWPWL